RLLPAHDAHPGALAGLGPDVELIRQALRAAEPEAEALATGVAVAEGACDVRDSGALVDELQAHAAPDAAEHLEFDPSASAVIERVARQFAGRGDDLRLIDQTHRGLD